MTDTPTRNKTKKTTFHCRAIKIEYLSDDNKSEKTFHDLFMDAIDSDNVSYPIQRVQSKEDYILMETHKPSKENENKKIPFIKNKCLCGILVTHDPVTKTPTVLVSDNNVERESIKVMNKDNKEVSVEKNNVYFAILGNYVAVASSSRSWSDIFLKFSKWLINTKSGVLPGTDFYLTNIVSKEAVALAAKSPVKKIIVKSPHIKRLEEENGAIKDADASGSNTKEEKSAFRMAGKTVLSVIRSIIGEEQSAKLTANLKPEELEYIQATLELTYGVMPRGRNESKSEHACRNLSNVATILRDSDDVDAEVELTDGGRIKKKELSINEPHDIEIADDRVIPSKALECLSSWLTSLKTSGRITS